MLSERFTQALTWGHRLDAKQVGKGSGVPYISHHLLGVTTIALEYGRNEDEALAALLHDAIEDQGGPATRKEIRRRFGDNVTAMMDVQMQIPHLNPLGKSVNKRILPIFILRPP
jgi:GTP pyrophosphokinase